MEYAKNRDNQYAVIRRHLEIVRSLFSQRRVFMGSWRLATSWLNPTKTTRMFLRHLVDDHHQMETNLCFHQGKFVVRCEVHMFNVSRDTYATSELYAIEAIQSCLIGYYSVASMEYYITASNFQVELENDIQVIICCISVPDYDGGQIPKFRAWRKLRVRKPKRRVDKMKGEQKEDIMTCTNVIVNKGRVAQVPISPCELYVYIDDQFDSWVADLQ